MENKTKSDVVALQLEIENIDTQLESIEGQINRLISKQDRLTEQKKKLQNNLDVLQKESTSENVNWKSRKFPWSDKIKTCLNERFHIVEFRSLQEETINVTMSKKDCILIMPTGGGKSLCFQLPALLSSGFTLVMYCYLIFKEVDFVSISQQT